MAIGARAQSAKTYLEKKYLEFENASLDELVKHALFALRETAGQKSEGLTMQNTTVAVVGLDQEFVIHEDEKVQPFVSSFSSYF